MHTETNSAFIIEVLRFICKKLNDKSINYYIGGAVGAYIDANIPFQRIHDDIDIMIEEKYLNELESIFRDTDFEYHDNRLSSTKILNEYGFTEGDHEVYAQHKYSDFHIGFFLYHCDNNSCTLTEYFNDKGIQKKLERTFPIEFFKAQYNDSIIDYLDIKLKTIRKETIYKNKTVMNRKKDLFDIKILKPIIDVDKLNKLSGLSKYRNMVISNL